MVSGCRCSEPSAASKNVRIQYLVDIHLVGAGQYQGQGLFIKMHARCRGQSAGAAMALEHVQHAGTMLVVSHCIAAMAWSARHMQRNKLAYGANSMMQGTVLRLGYCAATCIHWQVLKLADGKGNWYSTLSQVQGSHGVFSSFELCV